MNLKKIIEGKYKNIVILGINVILLFFLFTKIIENTIHALDNTKIIGNIFYAIDTENISLIKTIVTINPGIIIKKHEGIELARNYIYSIPLAYASDRSYPQKDIIMFLLEKTHKYYNDNYYDNIDRMRELDIILYNLFKTCLINADKLNPNSFKDYPDYDIPDRILELGFPIDYYFNVDNYWSIKKWVTALSCSSEEKKTRIKEYLISKELSLDE